MEAVENFNGPLCFAAESDYSLFEFAWHFPGEKSSVVVISGRLNLTFFPIELRNHSLNL